ncbi:ABC transporter substrate-binding protein [Cohnella cellulosilytica]|uniref:ABC transporter substrate-binding protein n=1 Tax=Cohnella cellulosilytica TaxID=986710 RepID=A0ABW2FEY1_9BACL
MKQRFSLLVGFMLVVGCAVAYMIVASSQRSGSERETGQSRSLNVWIYSEELAGFFDRYEMEHSGVNVNLRVFRSWKTLYEELLTAVSANAAPQLAEIGSTYGVMQLVNRGAMLPVGERIGPELWKRVSEPFAAAFSNGGTAWAAPLGGSVPVLYGNRNLFNAAQVDETLADWPAIGTAGRALTKDIDRDGRTDIWGLVADANMAWHHLNMAYDPAVGGRSEEKILDSFERWREYLNADRITPPLQHQMAASQFIYGKAGMLLATSRKRPTLEKYIGGKFEFGIVPLPGEPGQADLLPEISGLAVLSPASEEEDLAWDCVRYMLDESVQSRLMRDASLIPARGDVAKRLLKSGELTERENAIMRLKDRFAVKYPTVEDESAWNKYSGDQEWLESSPDVSPEALRKRLRH